MERKGKAENFARKRASPSTPSIAWPHCEFSSSVSARKLCASLWELQSHYPLPNMCKGPPKFHLQHFTDDGDGNVDIDDHPLARTPLHQPISSTKHIAASVERNGSVSPSKSYPIFNEFPALSLNGNGGSGFRLKTSTELLKVLNRIWALEEQHVSNMSLVKALRTELDCARARIKDLTEQERIEVTIQSLRGELEDERKLRKHSESLHCKLARQLSGVKSCLADALTELERERKARTLLETLCDELAKSVQCLKQKHHVVDQVDWENPDLILHISEAWLDERMQIKPAENNTTVDELNLDIQTFLGAKLNIGSRKCELIKEKGSRRRSLDSFPLNEAVTVPKGADNEEDSSHSNKQCDELNETTKIRPRDSSKGRKLHRSQGQFGDKVHNEGKFMEDSRLIQSVYTGRASPVQQWISKLKSPDIRKRSVEGRIITRSKTRRPAIV